jgi:hypothetical protein
MATWADFLMNGFTTKGGKKLVSDQQIQQLWNLQISTPVALKNSYDSNFGGYGLGWFLTDVKGHKQVYHTGGLIGTVTQFTLIPDMKLGIIVLTNQQSGAAFSSITNTVKDSYLGMPQKNWLKTYGDRMSKINADFDQRKKEIFAKSEAFKKDKNGQIKGEQILGTYIDPWFGEVTILNDGKAFRIICKNSPRLKGELLPYSSNVMIAKWDDRSYDADVFVNFNLDENGKATGMKLKPISDVTDFSFDFEDLDLKRKN